MRLLEGGVVPDGSGVEHHHVGVVPGLEPAAPGYAQVGGGQARESANALLQREHLLVAHVLAQKARKGAVRSRVGVALEKRAFGGHGGRIGAHTHPRLAQLRGDVVLVDDEVDGAHPRAVLHHQIHGRFFGRRAAQLGHGREGLARVLLERIRLESRQHDALRRTGRQQQALPLVRWRAHFLRHLPANGRVLQSLRPRGVPALLHPGRHGGVESGGTCGVGVDVGGDLEPRRPCRIDARQHPRHLRPVGLARRLEMIDLGARATLTGNGQELLDRLLEAHSFAAQMRDVHAPVGGGGLHERHQFRGLRVERRRVDEGGAHAQRALLHGRPHIGLHGRQLRRRGFTIVPAHVIDADGGGSHERRDVGADPLLHEGVLIATQRAPGDGIPDVPLLRQHLGSQGIGERSHGLALPHHLERDALANVPLTAAVLDERFGGPAEHVDETGRHGKPRGIHLQLPLLGHRAHRHDGVAADGHVGRHRGASRSVVDRAAANHDIIGWLPSAGGGQRQGTAKRHSSPQATPCRVANGREAKSTHRKSRGIGWNP